MKLYYVIASITIVTYLDSVRGMTINEFFSNGWDTISATWNQIKTAIKQPVRLKRLGPGGRKKTTKSHQNNVSSTPSVGVRAMHDDVIARLRHLSSTKNFISSRRTTSKKITSPRTAESTRSTPTSHTTTIHTTTTHPTTTTTAVVTRGPTTPPTTGENKEIQTLMPSQLSLRVNVPYLSAPVWKSVRDWKHMQRPLTFMTKDKATSKASTTYMSTTYFFEKNTESKLSETEDSGEGFGSLVFI